MGILQRLRLRRRSAFEPRTLLDALLSSPLQSLISTLYTFFLSLRGRPFHPPAHHPIRVVCLSDTHDQIPRAADIPPGDLLIHAGDLTNAGTASDIQLQIDWLASLPHTHKVVIAGNHDSYFDPKSRSLSDTTFRTRVNIPKGKNIHYLEHDSITLHFPNRNNRSLKIHGAPSIPRCGPSTFAFQYDLSSPPWPGSIPPDTDVLVTHPPPRGHLDLGTQGCPSLLSELWRLPSRPKLHVVGHVHYGHGKRAMFFDNCQRAYDDLMARPSRGLLRDLIPHWGWLDGLRVLLFGIHAVVFKLLMLGPGGNVSGSWLVNAALMRGNSKKLGNPAQVVDL